MFKRKQKAAGPQPIATLIGVGTVITGDVVFKGGLHIDGRVSGNVMAEASAAASLSLSDSGVIEGAVEVPNLVLNGTVHGDITTHERVELGATAKVFGNLSYGLIEMAIGAQINGKLIPLRPQAGDQAKAASAAGEPSATAANGELG